MKFVVALCCISVSLAQLIDDEKVRFVDDFWEKVDKDDDGFVGLTELNGYISSFDNKDDIPIRLNIFETDYKSGNRNIPADYEMSVPFAITFFKMQDVINEVDGLPDFLERLTTEDTAFVVGYGDLDEDQLLNETEFVNAYSRVLRGAPFGLLYVNYRASEGTGSYDDFLEFNEWSAIWDDIVQGSTFINNNEFAEFWTTQYGSRENAREVFDWLDIERSGLIYKDEWDLWFALLDYDGDGYLAIEEVLVLDYLVNEGQLPRQYARLEEVFAKHGRILF